MDEELIGLYHWDPPYAEIFNRRVIAIDISG
jgi:hypothetical protein